MSPLSVAQKMQHTAVCPHRANTWFKIVSQGTPVVFPGTRSWTAGCLGRTVVIPVLRASFQDWDPPVSLLSRERARGLSYKEAVVVIERK